FRGQIGEYPVYFLCDHIAKDNSWSVTHSHVRWGEEEYPYTDCDAQALRRRMAGETRPMITCGHYGFCGCNRDHELMDRLLPLPPNERILTIELFNAAQALDFRKPVKSSAFIENFVAEYRKKVEFVKVDKVMYTEIAKSVEFLQNYNLGEKIFEK
ncbi:MAG: hypothetical protein J6X10_06925, partial [Bacteroidales bacterium]|nr:hypothetical protein [Bacteroidales bacterium]